MKFSERRLSYDSDALNAILGIFNSLQRSKEMMLKQIWGIPIKMSSHDSSFLIPLNWYHNQVARRREEFPSWSWTGWDGGVSMTDPDVRVSEDCKLELLGQSESRAENGSSLSEVMDVATSPSHIGHSNPPKVLQITARTINVTLQYKTWGNLNDSFSQNSQNDSVRFLDGFHAKLPITENVWALVYAYLDQEEMPSTEAVGLVLGQKTSKVGLGILLLEPRGDSYQRVGILRYRDGRGTEAGGGHISHIVYVDAEENVLEEVEALGSYPLWLQSGEMRTIRVV